jgi:CBS domain-containing protein/gamma-glutamyl:cysteine ligase YbdK (ATP-grasp superfamily)
MGDHDIEKVELEGEGLRSFLGALLADLRALEELIETGQIESGVRRIGAEQEMFLVDGGWSPALKSMEILERLNDPHFTTELGLFNLEVNLDPLEFGPDCLGRMETQLNHLLSKVEEAAREFDCRPVLTGILPTIRKSHLGLESMAPLPRYQALNRAFNRLRGEDYEFRIKGLDELILKHDSVMLEACNASFQVHFQVGAEEFANLYNIAQAVAGPVLATATFSPFLLGRRLWQETRIAVFQQAVDTRNSSHYLREFSPRVTFGRKWVETSVLELFREDVTRFRALIRADLDGSSPAAANGAPPQLKALRLHNGTVYRWNRACYGVIDGKAHLRIENRVLPSGPSVVDEVANAAFWFGLIIWLSTEYEDVTKVLSFDDAKMNFLTAARQGLDAQLRWLDGRTLPARELICEHLVPKAADGLRRRGIQASHVDRYLGIIDQRVRSGRTGSEWMTRSFSRMSGEGTTGELLSALTAAMVERQKEGLPVSEWKEAEIEEGGGRKGSFLRVEQYMTTDLYTVREDEPIDLVANLMEWEKIRHVPVEDNEHRLVGLVSYRILLRLMARGWPEGFSRAQAVSDIMKKDPVSIPPDTSTLEAIRLMRRHKIGCLPVVKDERLIGIVTEHDLANIAAKLLEKLLTD